MSVFSEQPSRSSKKLMPSYSHFHGGALDVRRISSLGMLSRSVLHRVFHDVSLGRMIFSLRSEPLLTSRNGT